MSRARGVAPRSPPVEIDGVTRPLAEWRRAASISRQTYHYRVRKLGLSVAEALTTPKLTAGRGRPYVLLDLDEVMVLRERGLSYREVARALGVSRATLQQRASLFEAMELEERCGTACTTN